MKKLVIGLSLILANLAQAAVVCEGTSPIGPAKVTYDRTQVQVEGGVP